MTVCVEIRIDPADAELVSDRLWGAGAVAIEEREDAGALVLIAGFDDPVAAETVAAAHGGRTFEPEPDAGLDAWRPHARVWRAGERCVVRPPWLDADGDVVLVIDPGHAFGSGSHASTRLALAHVERLVHPGARVADIGCGSGVLAVAAARLGADHVDAVDVDPRAVAATDANAALNGVTHRITASTTPAGELAGPYDVVLANIGAAVLRDLAPTLTALVAADGALVLSGLLREQLADVVAAYPGFVVDGVGEEGGWAAPALRRPVGAG